MAYAGARMAPAFVVCTGRCGSTALTNMIRLHPAILSLSEYFTFVDAAFRPDPIDGERFWAHLSQPTPQVRFLMSSGIQVDEVLYQPRPGGRFTAETGVPPIMLTALPHLTDEPEALYDEIGRWAVAQDPRPAADHHRALFAWLMERLGGAVWFERSGLSLPRTASLAAAFPEARFVHLYRDGRDCAMSMAHHEAFRMMWMRGGLTQALEPRTAPEPAAGAPPPPAPPPLDRERLAAAHVPPADMGRFWSELEVRGAGPLERLEPDRVLHLGYEALIAEPAAELARLAAFIGVEAGAAWLDRASALARPRARRWRELPEDQLADLTEACAPGMRLLYGSVWPD